MAVSPPNVVHSAVFLKAVARGDPTTAISARKNAGGPTAATGARNGLRFLQLHLGVDFSCGEEEVDTAGDAPLKNHALFYCFKKTSFF